MIVFALAFLVFGAVQASAVPTASAAASPPTLGARELRPGDQAEVRTVFEGSRVESFQAEIVGVIEGGRAEGSLILARATAGRALSSGIALGMSGSPVYVRGKLVGALSGSWSFTREPVFAITPIAEMLAVFEHPSAGAEDGTAGPTGVEVGGSSAGARFNEFRWDDADPGSDPLADVEADPSPEAARGGGEWNTAPHRLPLPLACGGLHPDAFAMVRQWLSPFGLAATPGGRASAAAAGPDSVVPGSAVAIELLRGDLQLSAIGTVTYRDGDRVLLFGHPMFQAGEVRLPLATAEIATVIPSQQASFKLGVPGRAIGVAVQDRRAGVGARLGGAPHMLPFTVRVRRQGEGEQRFRFETIEDRSLAPTLVATATLNSLLESGGMGSNQTLRWTLELYRGSAPPLSLEDVVAAEAPAIGLARSVNAPLRFLYNSPFGRLGLDSARVIVDIEPGRDQWTLRNARVLESAVRPGGRIRVSCEIDRWRGAAETREFSIEVPRELPDGRYLLWLGGGGELSRYEAKRLPGRYHPTSLDDAWRRLSEARSNDALYASLFAQAPEVTSEGRDYPELPLSSLALFSTRQSAGDRVRSGTLARFQETRLPVGGLVRGELQLPVEVDSRAP